jgi:DNA-binding response OmpR family regulator
MLHGLVGQSYDDTVKSGSGTSGMVTAESPGTRDVAATVLVIEDDPADRRLISETLRREGLTPIETDRGVRALQVLSARPVDLIVLDLGLTDGSGLELLAEIRRHHGIPVIIATGQGDTETEVVGLRLGADDYVTKPFSPALLAARVSAVLRRSRSTTPTQRLRFGPLHIDVPARQVSVDDQMVDMPSREFELLAFLARHPRQVFSREQLLERVWESSEQWQSPATVTEHVRKLRARIERDPAAPRWIVTVRGIGYRFDP